MLNVSVVPHKFNFSKLVEDMGGVWRRGGGAKRTVGFSVIISLTFNWFFFFLRKEL